ncbi:WG repeat-containing protein [Oceanirhabdus seepicola]|uniref:WG repeat-containing protein n=1 Tax=Oceanirhabdus seepicola TaxID=2828781 RepID=A0A9J6P321_9CLOT|nr:WG repeat-containing protein [Oceanirhabdus seepicola]MCM1990598.1 WG repeat-containing protein [Oceanirhabdus seepicola]
MSYQLGSASYENELYSVNVLYNKPECYESPLDKYIVINFQIRVKNNTSTISERLNIKDLIFHIETGRYRYQNIDITKNKEILDYVEKTDSYYEFIGQDYLEAGQTQTYLLIFEVPNNKDYKIDRISWYGKNFENGGGVASMLSVIEGKKKKFKYMGKFSEGLASVCINDKYGFIDENYDIVIEPQFFSCREFEDGYAYVLTGSNPLWKKISYINKKGQFVIEPTINDFKAMIELRNYKKTHPYG